MQTIKNIFKNKTFRMVAIGALVILAAWTAYTVITRNKKRAAFISWMNSLPANDEWKALVIKQAKEKGLTVEAMIEETARYQIPTNPFKPLK